MHELLKPSGKLVGVLFEGELGTQFPPFGGSREEYLSYFQPLFKVLVMEPCYNSIPPRRDKELFFILEKTG